MHGEESIVEGKMKGKKRENKLIAAQEIMGSMGRVENIEERNKREVLSETKKRQTDS